MVGEAATAYIVMRADGSLLPRDIKRYAGEAGEEGADSFADKFDDTLEAETGKTLRNFTRRLSKSIENVDFSGLQNKSEAYTDTVRRLTHEVGELYDNHLISRKAAEAYLDSIGDWSKRQAQMAGYNRVVMEQNEAWKAAQKETAKYRKSVAGLGDQLVDFEGKYRAALDPKILKAFIDPGGWGRFIQQVGDAGKASKVLSDRMDELVRADSQFAAQRDEVMASFQAHVDGAKRVEKSAKRMDRFRKTVGAAGGAVKKLGRSFHNVATSSKMFEPTLAKIGIGLLTMSSIIPSVFSLVGVIGLLPGALTIAAGAAATLAVGFSGLGKALGSMDDLEAFNKALKDLAPSAQSFAKAVRSVRGEWAAMQESVQQELFAGLGKQFTALSNTYLPIVQTGFEAIARSANNTAKEISKALQEATSTQAVELALHSTEVAVQRLGEGFASATPGILQLSAESARLFAEMSGGADAAGERFSAFVDKIITDGSFQKWVKEGVAAFGDLARGIGSIISIFNGIGEAAERAGGPTLDSIADGLGNIADVVNGDAFQKDATEFFTSLYKGMDGVKSALPSVTDAFGNFFDILGNSAETFGPSLGNSIAAVSDAFSSMAPGINSAIDAMGPAFEAISNTMGTVLPAIGEQLGPIISSIAEAIGPMIEKIAPKVEGIGLAFAGLLEAIRPVVDAILPILMPVVSFFSGILLGAVKGAIEGITQVVNGVVQFFKGIVQIFKSLIAGDWAGVWEGLKTAAMGIFNAIVGAIKVWLNVTILSVFRKGLFSLLKNWKSVWNGIKNAAMAVWNAIKGFFTKSWGGIKALAVSIWNGIKTFFASFWNGVKAVFTAAWNVIKAQLLLVWNVIKTSAVAVWNGLRAFFSTFWNGVKAVFTTVWNAIKATLTAVWNSIKAVATTVWNGIKAFFTKWWAGVQATFRVAVALVKSVVSKAWNAIKSVTSTVWNGIKNFISKAWSQISGRVTNAVSTIRSLISKAWNTIKSLTSSVWNGIKSVISSVWNGIKSFVSSAVSRVKSVITSGWNTIKSLTSSVWNGIKSLIRSVWNGIKSFISSAVSRVRSVITSGWNRIKSLTSSVWNGIKNLIRSTWNTIKSLIRSAISAVRSVISSGWNRVKSLTSSAFNRMKSIVSNAWSKIRSAVSNGISRVVGYVRRLPGKIKSALGNLGSLLKSAGKAVIQGLINGITSKVGALKGKLNGITGKMKDWKGPYNKDKKLLTPAGVAIMGGLIDGIDKQVPALRKMLGEVTSEIENTSMGMPSLNGLNGRRVGATPIRSTMPRRSIADMAGSNPWMRTAGGVDNRSTRSTTIAPGAIQISAPYTDPELAAQRVLDGIVNDL